MEHDEIERLNPLQTFLLVLVEFGLTTPYDLLSKAGLGPGLTSPALKRLEQAGLLTSTPGPRKRLRYAMTEKGANLLRESLRPGEVNYWQAGQADTFESLPRGIVLAWLYTGIEEASRGVDRAADKLLFLGQRRNREAEELRGLMLRLQADIVSEDPAADKGMLIATAYQWLKAESDAALFQLQAEAIRKVAPLLLAELPRSPVAGAQIAPLNADVKALVSPKVAKQHASPQSKPSTSRGRKGIRRKRIQVQAAQVPFDLDGLPTTEG